MLNQSLARGVALAGIALAFGAGALRLPIGSLSHSGAGLFPLMVSGLLLVLAMIVIVKSFLTEPVALYVNVKNISLILLGLAGFVAFAKFTNTALAIVWLVFTAAFAGTSYSWQRNLKISIGLILIALVFEKFLGLNLQVF